MKFALIPTVLAVLSTGLSLTLTSAQQSDLQERFRRMSAEAEEQGLAEPFLGITTNGQVLPGLFGVRSTGVLTARRGGTPGNHSTVGVSCAYSE
ncbi:MAG: hypothetical protein ACWGSQ_08560 [Longimicrobiales bacterium]